MPAKCNSPPATSVVVLGGGLSGVAAAFTLARAGVRDVTVLESGAQPGRAGRELRAGGSLLPAGLPPHPASRPHAALLSRPDRRPPGRPLASDPDAVPARRRGVRAGNPRGVSPVPHEPADKARFVRLMLTAFARATGPPGRTAAPPSWWTTTRARASVRRSSSDSPGSSSSFPASEVSGAWLGARLHFREGSAPLGYIPGANWTKVLCDGVARLLAERACACGSGPGSPACTPRRGGSPRRSSTAASGSRRTAFVSTVPTEVYLRLVPEDGHAGAGRDPVLRPALGGLRHPAGGPTGRLLEQPGIAGPDRRRASSCSARSTPRSGGRAIPASTS